MSDNTFLIDFLEKTFLTQRNIGRQHACNLRSLIDSFSDHLRRRALVADLTAENVNVFLQHQQTLGRSPKTLHGYRANFIAFAKDAKIALDPETVRRFRQQRRIPDAWTMDELVRLLNACNDPQFDKPVRQYVVKQGDYLRALVLTSYDTGLRPGDLMELRRDEINSNGEFTILQNKTGVEMLRAVRKETLAAIDRMYVRRVTVPLFGFCSAANRDYPMFLVRKLVEAAGFEHNRRNGMQKLRRTSATHLETVSPGSASWHLGHLDGNMARLHYLDQRIIQAKLVFPPEIRKGKGGRRG